MLDVGCGTGILSLLVAKEGGAKRVCNPHKVLREFLNDKVDFYC